MFFLLEKIVPIFIILGIGMLIRKTNLLSNQAMSEIKELISKIALPCILFVSFANADIQPRYIWIFIIVFAFCMVCFAAGALLKRFFPNLLGSFFTPWFMSGYEFGMIGIALFTSIWGFDHLPILMVIALGHEFFTWFVCIPYVQYKLKGTVAFGQAAKDFFSSPVMISIFFGIVANVTGLYLFLTKVFWGKAILSVMDILSGLGVPLILLTVGYAMVFEKMDVKKAICFIFAKIALVCTFGLSSLALIHAILGEIDPMFDICYYTLLILPPSYYLSVLVPEPAEKKFFSQVTVYYTVFAFLIYAIVITL